MTAYSLSPKAVRERAGIEREKLYALYSRLSCATKTLSDLRKIAPGIRQKKKLDDTLLRISEAERVLELTRDEIAKIYDARRLCVPASG